MYTFPAEVMSTLQAHWTCEHNALAQDTGNIWFVHCHIVLSQVGLFHDLEKLLSAEMQHSSLQIFYSVRINKFSKSSKLTS